MGILGALGSVLIGTFVGVFAGYFEKLDGLLSGATDATMAFPALPLMILVGALFVATDQLLVFLLALVLWPPVARSIRVQTSSIKKLAYVDTAKLSGMKGWQIVTRVIIPKISPISVAYFILNVSTGLILVTAIEFLGVGNPTVVSWGSMLYWAQQFAFYSGDWWWILAPGLSISIIATSFALIGFSFEEITNPRLKV